MFGFFEKSVDIKLALPAFVQKICDLSPVEFSRPSFSNFTNNVFLISSALLWVPAKAGICWNHDDMSYGLYCDNSYLYHRQILAQHLLGLINKTCGDITYIQNIRHCPGSNSDYMEFGSNFFNTESLCEMRYPYKQIPDACIVDVLESNTPSGVFVPGIDSVLTGVFSATTLLTVGLFARHAHNKYYENKNQELSTHTGGEEDCMVLLNI